VQRLAQRESAEHEARGEAGQNYRKTSRHRVLYSVLKHVLCHNLKAHSFRLARARIFRSLDALVLHVRAHPVAINLFVTPNEQRSKMRKFDRSTKLADYIGRYIFTTYETVLEFLLA
jgi:hypothetical protein